MSPVISSLHIYPVKSCAGISVTETVITPQGLPFDRRWMVVDAETGRFVTQRTHPLMATIKADLPAAVLETGDVTAAGAGDAACLTLSAPGAAGEVKVPLVPKAGAAAPALRRAKVWEWDGPAADEGDEAAAWLTAAIGKPVRLVRYLGTVDAAAGAAAAELAAEATLSSGGPGGGGADAARGAMVRGVDPDFYQPKRGGGEDGGSGGGAGDHVSEVAFQDGFPLLLATAEAMADLNARIARRRSEDGGAGGDGSGGAPAAAPVSIDRFRANIIIASGAGGPWAEDRWGVVRLGGIGEGGGEGGSGISGAEAGAAAAAAAAAAGAGAKDAGVDVALVKPCSRCTVPLVDQATGAVARDKEPIATLQRFRTGAALGLDGRFGRGATFFGTNGVPLLPAGARVPIRVGDPLRVLERASWAAAA